MPLLPALLPPARTRNLSKWYIQLIMDDQYVVSVNLIKLLGAEDCFAAGIHKSRWLDDDDARAAERFAGHFCTQVFFVDPRGKVILFGKLLDAGKTNIMPRAIVLAANIAETYHEHGALMAQIINRYVSVSFGFANK
jgi:hypothetical protein